LNGSHPLLVCNDDTSFEGGSVHTVGETCVFTVASKESGLEVNIDSTEYVVMSQEQNGVQNSELRYQLYLLNMWQNLKYSEPHQRIKIYCIKLREY
jgi:hypothetical protein